MAYLLMTGERGLGWAAFHGARTITVAEVHRYRYMQERVNLASTDDGRKEMATSRALARAAAAIRAREEREQRERQQAASSRSTRSTPLPPAQIIGDMPPFDPARMTPEEVAAWARAYTPPV